MQPPPLPHQIAVLQRVLDSVANTSLDGAPPLVVFNLDGTLFDTRPRTAQILTEYGAAVRDDDPEVAEALAGVGVEDIRYLLSDTLRDRGLSHADLVRDVTAFWRERYYTDEYLAFDVPVSGAAAYVRACHEAGATIVYVTCRDVPAMLLGTVAALRDHGFPIAIPGVEMVLKPDATMGDEAFMRSHIPALGRSGDVVGFFEHESAICNLAAETYPQAHVALVETKLPPGAPDPAPGIELVSDFRSL